MTRVVTILTCGALALTSACTTASTARVDQAGAEQLVALCLDQTQAPGVYSWQYDGPLPVATALTAAGGTKQAANMVNACVRQNAALFETTTTPTVATATAAPDRVLSDPEPVPPGGVQKPRITTPAPATAEPKPVAQASPTRSNNSACPAGVTGLYRGTILC